MRILIEKSLGNSTWLDVGERWFNTFWYILFASLS